MRNTFTFPRVVSLQLPDNDQVLGFAVARTSTQLAQPASRVSVMMKVSLGEGFDQHESFAPDETASPEVMRETVTPMLRCSHSSSERSTSVQVDALPKRQSEIDTMRADERKTIATARADLDQRIMRVRRPLPRFETAALLSSSLLLLSEGLPRRCHQAEGSKRWSGRRRMCLVGCRGRNKELAATVSGVQSRIIEEAET